MMRKMKIIKYKIIMIKANKSNKKKRNKKKLIYWLLLMKELIVMKYTRRKEVKTGRKKVKKVT